MIATPVVAWPDSPLNTDVPIDGSSVPSCDCANCPAQNYAYRLEQRHYTDEHRSLPLELIAQGARDYLVGNLTRRRLRELVAALDAD